MLASLGERLLSEQPQIRWPRSAFCQASKGTTGAGESAPLRLVVTRALAFPLTQIPHPRALPPSPQDRVPLRALTLSVGSTVSSLSLLPLRPLSVRAALIVSRADPESAPFSVWTPSCPCPACGDRSSLRPGLSSCHSPTSKSTPPGAPQAREEHADVIEPLPNLPVSFFSTRPLGDSVLTPGHVWSHPRALARNAEDWQPLSTSAPGLSSRHPLREALLD